MHIVWKPFSYGFLIMNKAEVCMHVHGEKDMHAHMHLDARSMTKALHIFVLSS